MQPLASPRDLDGSAALEQVDFVTLVIRSASAHAGNDLELTSIAAVHLGGE